MIASQLAGNPLRGLLGGLSLLLILALVLALPAAGADETTWLGSAFELDAADLLEEARQSTKGETASVAVLLAESTHDLDTNGRRTYRHRLVYRILGEQALSGWDKVESNWTPWRQERPTMRARVVTPEGQEHWLEPDTIAERPASGGADDIFDDRRILEAPLPGLSVGAVVEEEVTVRETTAYYEPGSVTTEMLMMGAPIYEGRVTVEAPASTKLRYRVQMLEGTEPQESRVGDRQRVELVYQNMAAFTGIEEGMPSDIPRFPTFSFSTGKSWRAIATSYSKIVDARIAESDIDSLLAEAEQHESAADSSVPDALLAWVHDRVRYTGLELGIAGLVPFTPDETVERKFGDCKDQATLLTALLRAKGIPASVALLQTGPGQDLEAELPGLGRFDHAIVYIPGSPDLWIDPTSTYSRAGELPLSVQGRLALVAAPDSKELVRIPATEAQNNGAIEHRHIVLSDFGGGSVRETTVYKGSLEQGLRRLYASTDPEVVKDKVREYTVRSYFADDATVEHSDPRDLSSPFRIEIEAQGIQRASTDLSDAAVGIDSSYLLSNLPAYLVSDEPAREKPFALDEPHRMEIHYLIEPPAGMKVAQMPEDEEQHFGGATFSLASRELETGAVEIDLVFDSGPRVISAEDFEELRRGVEELAEREILLVHFQHTAQALLAAGKVREAVEENQRIVRLEPDKSIHRVRLAQSLLGAGLQGAALREASRAVELDPSSATAYWVQGWVRQHDDMGRRFGEGFDFDGAVASLRKAKEIDPNHRMARAELAILLEHNSSGVQFGTGADLEAAVAEHLSFREDFDSDAMNVNIMLGLLQSGRFEELEKFTEELPASEPRSLHRLVALTVNHGVDRAMTEAAREFKDAEDRVSNLSVVAQELIRLGRYPLAASLMNGIANLADNPAAILVWARQLESFRTLEEIEIDPRDPASVVVGLVKMTADGLLDRETAPDLLHPGLFALPGIERQWVDDALSAGLAEDNPAAFAQAEGQGLSPKVLAEMALGALEVRSEGDEQLGYRLSLQLRLGTTAEGTRIFVAPYEDGYRIVGASELAVGLGLEALRQLEMGEVEAAAQWLDWARKERPLVGVDDPLVERVFPRLWTATSTRDETTIRVAAAGLLIDEGLAAAGVPILEERVAQAEEIEDRLTLQVGLLDGNRLLERHLEVLRLSRELIKETTSPLAFMSAIDALVALDLSGDAQRMIRDRLADKPNDVAALRSQARLTAIHLDFDLHFSTCRQLEEIEEATGSTYNQWAWLHLFREPVAKEALGLAERAAQLTNYEEWDALHTLASVYASAGLPEAAYKTIVHGISLKPDGQPSDVDWYVLGRIAEEYGFRDDARDYYNRVGAPDPDGGPTTALLTQSRLDHLAKTEHQDRALIAAWR
ncbi:MAG: DUF3857 domain-containing protein [Acidobacteria bacterium]|nr:MAG: DUF3857 domain-containing protein [Acidobacteriota bacterium]